MAESAFSSAGFSGSYPASRLQTSLTTGYSLRLERSTREIDCSKKCFGNSLVGVEVRIICKICARSSSSKSLYSFAA